MSGETRWGILGTGLIASFFTQETADIAGSVVSAVASRRSGGASDFAERFGVERAFDSYAELVRSPNVDAVYVATPHSEHFAGAKLALEAGKHVLVEKPFTVNVRQAEELIAMATERGLFIMEAMRMQFLPHMHELRRLVAEGAVGDVVAVSADHGIRFDPAEPAHRLYDPTLGGGALLDLGVYAVAFVADFLGDPLEIRAVGTKTPTGVDASLAAAVIDGEGRVGSIVTSLSSELPNRASVSGTTGRIEVGYDYMIPSTLTIHRFSAGNPAKAESSSELTPAAPGLGLGLEAQEAARCISEGLLESPIVLHQTTLRTMRMMDEMRRQVGITYAADGSGHEGDA